MQQIILRFERSHALNSSGSSGAAAPHQALPPLMAFPPHTQAATPAATPLAGLHADHQTKVADALAAAVEVRCKTFRGG